MTGPDDDNETRPISVAELLARNGTIGAPPIGGRRRRRRGDSEAVTVAELTGEIPTVEGDEHPADHPDDRTPTNGTAEPDVDQAESPHYDEYEPDADENTDYFRVADYGVSPSRVSAEQMRPDPVDDDEDAAAAVAEERDEDDDLPSYLRSEHRPLFGGHTVADDVARRGSGRTKPSSSRGSALPDVPPEPTTADEHAEAEPPTTRQKLLRGGLVVLQSMVAVGFGAGLFIAFDQLWKWNNIVALVLSVLVILGLVVAVRVVRKTEDIASTLIAVAVGALVTLGPLALLQSN
jgi:hypothetical protein